MLMNLLTIVMDQETPVVRICVVQVHANENLPSVPHLEASYPVRYSCWLSTETTRSSPRLFRLLLFLIISVLLLFGH